MHKTKTIKIWQYRSVVQKKLLFYRIIFSKITSQTQIKIFDIMEISKWNQFPLLAQFFFFQLNKILNQFDFTGTA